jgi:hypothetical protein
MTKKYKIFIETQGDPTNPLVQTTPSTHFTILYKENLWNFAFLTVKCILVSKNGLIRAFCGRLFTYFLKTFQQLLFLLVT